LLSILEQYNSIYKKIDSIRGQISEAESVIGDIELKREDDVPARIAKLQEQIKKIDDEYMPKITAFRKLAEKNLESKNVQTIEAPPGYRVNLNRLRSWAMMIDPTSSDDPYAQRVNLVAKCDELFLTKKRQEFTERIDMLKNGESTVVSAEAEEKKSRIALLKEELSALANGKEAADFADAVSQINKRYCYETLPEIYPNKTDMPQSVAPGAYALPFDFDKERRKLIKALFGQFYDADNGMVLLPYEIKTDKEFAIAITCAPARMKQLDRGLQNFILNIINENPAGLNKVYVIDAVRFNSALLGPLKQLENTFAIERIPRNQEQLSAALEEIVSSFSDMDDALELYDSLNEYNEKNDIKRKLPKTTVILFGWPNAFVGRDREYVRRIMTNYERYGLSFVSVSYGVTDDKNAFSKALPEYAAHNAHNINMTPNETTVCLSGGRPQRFTWYSLPNELRSSYADSLKAIKAEKATTGNEYIKRYDMSELPLYTREYKKIELLFGIDSKDAAHSISFEDENFAVYLAGASRSGKSTLLHTLIAGIILNYHPDNAELWLADFKQLEFKRYIEHCPPHIKFILLDESTELIYGLIDRLTEKMTQRQRALARLGKERIDQLDPRDLAEPMPVIFVIIDEFSVMSQAIAESPNEKLRLQNLLANGAALGIRFLFASQTFTADIAGLTPTARALIQQRIAMRGAREEISETLELPANVKTEQVTNWMEALPAHYALIKHQTGTDTLPQVKRVLVMYFADYAPMDLFVDRLNQKMQAVTDYTPNDINTYVNKNPVLVDGSSFDAFNRNKFTEYINELKYKNKDDHTGGETFISLGTPRLMASMKAIVITPEARENIILIGRPAEQACIAAIISSAIQSYIAQGKKVQIWAYDKNKLYLTYKNSPWKTDEFRGVVFNEGTNAVCSAIYETKQKIRDKQKSDELIVLMGIDRICADFEFIESLDDGVLNNAEETQDEVKQDAAESAEHKPGEYNAKDDFQYIVKQGSRIGYHFMLCLNSYADLKQMALSSDIFRHRLAFQIPADDSRELFGNKNASALPEHICQYYDKMEGYSFKPYLHRDIGWEGWYVDNGGNAVNPYVGKLFKDG